MLTAITMAIKAHSLAWKKATLMHRDISPGNILLYGHYKEPATFQVYLADWDLAKPKEELDAEAQLLAKSGKRNRRRRRFCTWQFQSAAYQCLHDRKPYELSDDLEAFVHVVTWLAFKFFKHSQSGQPVALLTTYISYFDKCDNSMENWDLNTKCTMMRLGSPLVKGLRPGSPLAQLVRVLAELCKQHHESEDVFKYVRQPEDNPQAPRPQHNWTEDKARAILGDLIDSTDDGAESDTEPPPPPPPRRSPFRDYRKLAKAVAEAMNAPEDAWIGLEKVADQVPDVSILPSQGTKRSVADRDADASEAGHGHSTQGSSKRQRKAGAIERRVPKKPDHTKKSKLSAAGLARRVSDLRIVDSDISSTNSPSATALAQSAEEAPPGSSGAKAKGKEKGRAHAHVQ
ncbi:hypothetical protein C8Q73DRAFT_43165 [Cubamyces lactineus]|nr:hypothetical protein C8Q73DRAFT_43165 [Cubamyces lactineus]